MATKADSLLADTYKTLKLDNQPASKLYAAIPEIVSHLAMVNAVERIHVGTTGTISERLCMLALESIRETNPSFEYRRFRQDWKWIGDLLVPGDPYDLAISVKSYKAKERLLASGTGSLLTPTVGWGLFDDTKEWSSNRTASYLYRGFVAIYLPINTLVGVSPESKKITNINGKALLRALDDFPTDLRAAIVTSTHRVDFRKI